MMKVTGEDSGWSFSPRRMRLAVMKAAPCDAVGTWAGLFDDRDGVPFGIVEAAPLPATGADALERGIIAHATMLARRSWLLANPYDESLLRAEDRDLWCRTVGRSTFAVVPEPLYAIRVSITAERTFAREYRYAQRLNRVLFLRHGLRVVGLARTARAWTSSHVKAAVMQVAATLGQTRRLVRRRGRPPTEREHAMIVEALHSSTAEPQRP